MFKCCIRQTVILLLGHSQEGKEASGTYTRSLCSRSKSCKNGQMAYASRKGNQWLVRYKKYHYLERSVGIKLGFP